MTPRNTTWSGTHSQLQTQPRVAPRDDPKTTKSQKLWCHLYISEQMLVKGFDLVKKIIGHGGCNTKSIYEATGAKLRVRGRGSGHLEGRSEASVHLMLAVGTDGAACKNFEMAIERCVELLKHTETRFEHHCHRAGISKIQRPCFWIGALSDESRAHLSEKVLAATSRVPSSVDATAVTAAAPAAKQRKSHHGLKPVGAA
eukprot:gnl/TRDRNA2_/TRDRNA2_164072_c0_seq1.p1 gnl/TRDRNA2_/TRDRNA2_164072_c0~~gnl/TRDRNA2_/TRDRNA2_164072_c0_seq1.p1  ORF type:complete len:200 (-),score=34.08 gnl/TRDRNA2_/TRDRNA2_164072_c0_seq1:304-903(-)